MARESRIEKRHRRNVKGAGGESYKFVSPGRRGVPDRLDLYDMRRAAERLMDFVNEQIEMLDCTSYRVSLPSCRNEVERIVADCIRFTETKATGGKPRKGQAREHRRLRLKGFRVDVVNSLRPVDVTDSRVDIIPIGE